ncbi:hypothetical protein LXL04_005685 [Taraxacum kok-saghyz]
MPMTPSATGMRHRVYMPNGVKVRVSTLGWSSCGGFFPAGNLSSRPRQCFPESKPLLWGDWVQRMGVGFLFGVDSNSGLLSSVRRGTEREREREYLTLGDFDPINSKVTKKLAIHPLNDRRTRDFLEGKSVIFSISPPTSTCFALGGGGDFILSFILLSTLDFLEGKSVIFSVSPLTSTCFALGGGGDFILSFILLSTLDFVEGKSVIFSVSPLTSTCFALGGGGDFILSFILLSTLDFLEGKSVIFSVSPLTSTCFALGGGGDFILSLPADTLLAFVSFLSLLNFELSLSAFEVEPSEFLPGGIEALMDFLDAMSFNFSESRSAATLTCFSLGGRHTFDATDFFMTHVIGYGTAFDIKSAVKNKVGCIEFII